jgi:hypothetical protein
VPLVLGVEGEGEGVCDPLPGSPRPRSTEPRLLGPRCPPSRPARSMEPRLLCAALTPGEAASLAQASGSCVKDLLPDLHAITSKHVRQASNVSFWLIPSQGKERAGQL